MTVVLSLLAQVIHIALMLVTAPTLAGGLRWLEARLAGSRGPRLQQDWTDLRRLWRKQPDLAETASPVFRAVPPLAFALVLAVAALVPSFCLGMAFSPLADLIAIAGLLSASRVALALGALDIGTAAPGLAAGQIMRRGVMAEPGLWLLIFALALAAGSSNLEAVVSLQLSGLLQPSAGSALAAAALVGLVLADRLDPPGDLAREFSGSGLALLQVTGSLRLLVWLDLIGALFLPVGMAQVDSGIADWLVGLASWAVRLLVLAGALAVLKALAGGPIWRMLPHFLGVTVLLAFLAAMLILANAGAV